MQKIDRTGETSYTKEGYEIIISEYRNYNDIDVLFTKNNYLVKTSYKEFKNGGIKNPYHPSVYGVGGILRNFSRDTLGGAFKATCVCRNGVWTPIMKDPITDQGKKSYKGFVYVTKQDGKYVTSNEVTENDLLTTVFKDGKLIKDYTWEEIKERYNQELGVEQSEIQY